MRLVAVLSNGLVTGYKGAAAVLLAEVVLLDARDPGMVGGLVAMLMFWVSVAKVPYGIVVGTWNAVVGVILRQDSCH